MTMAFNDRERRQLEKQENILFKLKESRRWLDGCAGNINGMHVGIVVGIQGKLDTLITEFEKQVKGWQTDALDKDSR
jgi:hypothetical protein